ncbi:hypothetical protein LCGC14_0426610 [marine sediment metagenome]|uniref:Uncharacterized protein n=1 Tax=marine sediment metagenome TaxID=412755 RepID=A0A0F9VYT0_9ZZZZ
MPYISKDSRAEHDDEINELAIKLNELENDELSGHLNYVFFRLAGLLCQEDDLSYARMAVVSSAMSEAQAEFRRRVMAPYENEKIKENGDVKL